MIRPAPVLLLAFLAAALARGAGMDERAQRIAGVDRPARAAFAFAPLPDWSSAASGPLRPTNAPASGPPEIDLDEVEPLLPSSRNWYRSWLAATNPPAPPAGPVVLDALVLPAAGCVSPRRDADGPLVEVFVAEPAMLRALVQRYRAGLAPTNIPVNLGHDRSHVVGSVSDLWWVEGEGVWARLRVSSIGSRAYPSCEVNGLRAQATDAWGTWADFFLPWRIVGVGLVDKPALATPVLNPSEPPVLSPYPGIIR